MGSLYQDMNRLTQEITSGRSKRTHFINDLHRQTAGLKSDTEHLLASIRSELTEKSRKARSERESFIGNLKQDLNQFQNDFRRKQEASREKTRSELAALREKIKTEVFNLQSEVHDKIQGFRKNREEMSARSKQELQDFYQDLKRFVADLQEAVAQMEFKQFARDLPEEVAKLRENFRKVQARTFEEAARDRKQALEAIHQSLDALFADIAGLRSEFRDDLHKARTIWNETASRRQAGKSPETRQSGPAFEEPVEPAQADATPPRAEPEASDLQEDLQEPEDDLMQISGIGQGRKNLFSQAGITTFAQLAAATPEAVRDLIGEATPLSTIQKWIDQAKEFSR